MVEVGWHSLDIEEVMKLLRSRLEGLSLEEARRRLAEYGPNELVKEKGRSPITVFLNQFKNFLIIILLIAVGVSGLVGEVLDALFILAIVIACAFLGFIQEYRAERALEALKKLTAPMALVIRGGEEVKLEARDIVPGDIIVLHAGYKVPADARLIKAISLGVDESSLTGESTPILKDVEKLPEDTPIPDRRNMVFSGTVITYGRGLAIATSTGMRTEFGRIASMVQRTEKMKTPLEARVENIGKWLGILCLAVASTVAFLGILRGYGWIEMLIWGVSLAVAAVPEALPAVVTGALAIGMYRMARRHAIVRKLPAVETLGCTTFICSDKTGTMTKGEMTVRRIYVDERLIELTGVGYEPKGAFNYAGEQLNPKEGEGLILLLKAASLCNDAKLGKEGRRWVVRGDPTEGALLVAAAKAGLGEEVFKSQPRIGEIPFTSERKRMTTVHLKPEGGKVAYMKGALETVLNLCTYIYKDGRVEELKGLDREELFKVNESMAREALRNLAIAYKEVGYVPSPLDESFEAGFIFLGIVGMIDPPREEVKEALKLCDKAGVKAVMITGDHKLTALSVAKELGMLRKGGGLVLTGAELERMGDEDFERIVEDVSIYARVSPEHKVRIVKTLKKRGHVVAMTGDGVNDSPALKMADIGVAMGITGTDVAKEASDMVLADDNFATIVTAVKEGREIYDNIKKYLAYLLQCNISEILLMLIATLIGLPLPLTAIQILWINLATDGLPALALGVDPADPDIMFRPPRNPKESVFSKEVKKYLTLTPIIVTSILLLGFIQLNIANIAELTKARTRIFTAMVFMELAIALTCRSLRYPSLKVGIFANKILWIAIASSLTLQLTILYIPYLHHTFDITYPDPFDLSFAIGSALLTFLLIEIIKPLAAASPFSKP